MPGQERSGVLFCSAAPRHRAWCVRTRVCTELLTLALPPLSTDLLRPPAPGLDGVWLLYSAFSSARSVRRERVLAMVDVPKRARVLVRARVCVRVCVSSSSCLGAGVRVGDGVVLVLVTVL